MLQGDENTGRVFHFAGEAGQTEPDVSQRLVQKAAASRCLPRHSTPTTRQNECRSENSKLKILNRAATRMSQFPDEL